MFDPVLLRSFVAVVDCANFTRAAERLHLTQSTVSQQVRRLEESLDCQLLDRDQRRVVATAEGERLLGYARRILALNEEASDVLLHQQSEGVLRLGVPEDFAAERLMPLLSRFGQDHPGVRLEVTSGLGPELTRLYRRGEFDLLLVKQMGASDDCLASWPEPLCWVDSRATPALGRDPLPLVAFPVGGLYRHEMLHHLEVGGWRWRIGYSSASLASVCSAVAAGLGISLLPVRVVAAGHRMLDGVSGLPDIRGVRLALYGRSGLSRAGKALESQLLELCESQALKV
ncbi:DNA-binding transcriptional regulator, LysR family [Pseudomonas chlororaphis]|uniref:LysR family transcriptional regulator n=1 Tax=Pseudomonas chlororaphis TaxID=587753 RepID=UPI00087A43F3|nr:LysR substrate-binding domain-containing protein [Pseudomonas chlororaphis]AZD64170.1 Transcriptional regulator, LysR family [Pseudomonas chlororaphis subsp. aurantiaca]QIT20386.1 LysR family transcriptional regulator [Pseudomonas chlororaphis subsp. aurantiaca]WDH04534.1 LysR substrate-binding domain-containing protein [Pseudomonas chlororaphis]WDH12711.1 LysR substrate-binding domain-containing protein [Pseudomonas chlororaphis]SDT67650.1 DNA-binding transcriptional regulator, LysR family